MSTTNKSVQLFFQQPTAEIKTKCDTSQTVVTNHKFRQWFVANKTFQTKRTGFEPMNLKHWVVALSSRL